MQLSPQDTVWNRAALEAGGRAPREGDRALAAILDAHGFVMNGGVEHACEVLTREQCLAAIKGFQYFGLASAARVFEIALVAPAIDSNVYDRDYWAAVPDDSTIVKAFEAHYHTAPEKYAPTEHQSHA